MNIETIQAVAVPTIFAGLLVSCGGGGSSGGGSQPGSSGVAAPPVITVGACTQRLEDAIDNNTSTPLRLTNLSGGCDYLIDEDITIREDVVIDDGVTFVLQEGIDLTFRVSEVLIEGTQSSPVRFQAADANSPWGMINFTRGGNINGAVFSGGGAVSANADTQAMVIANASGGGLSITESSFLNSVSAGLVLDDTSAQTEDLVFEANIIASNSGVALVIDRNLVSFLGRNNAFGGSAGANAISGIEIDSRFINGQIFKNLNTPYRLKNSIQPSGQSGGVNIRSSAIEAGVEFIVADDTDISFTESLLNGTQQLPVVFNSVDGSESGWGGLELDRDNHVRNLIVNNGGSVASSIGGAVSVNTNRGTIENMMINNSRSWGVVCSSSTSSSQPQSISISGLVISEAVLGDSDPSCMLDQSPVVSDAERRDVTQCNETILVNSALSSELRVFPNSDADCDYYVIGDLEINEATIVAGAKFIFARGASLSTSGFIVSEGTVSEPIEFLGEEQSDGYWDGIALEGTNFKLTHTNVENGGVDAAIELTSSVSVFSDNPPALANISNVSVSGSSGNGMTVGEGILIEDFTDNSFTSNQGYGLALSITQVATLDDSNIYDLSTSANGLSGIRLIEESNLRGGEYTLKDLGVPWSISTLSIGRRGFDSMLPHPKLFVDAGVRIYVDESGRIDVQEFELRNGEEPPAILISGTSEKPVIISGPPEDPQNWRGIFASNFSATHLTVTGGGFDSEIDGPVTGRGPFGALNFIRGSIVDLDTVSISNSHGWAIDCNTSGGSVVFQVINNVTYMSNRLGDINPDCS